MKISIFACVGIIIGFVINLLSAVRSPKREDEALARKENEWLRRSVERTNKLNALIVVIAAVLSGCATTQHPPMKPVFQPHFKSDFDANLGTPKQEAANLTPFDPKGGPF